MPSTAPPGRLRRGLRPAPTLVVNSGLCGQGQLEAGEVAGSAPVEGVAVPPGVQADEVEGDGGVDVFEMGLGQALVAGVAGAGDGDGLMHGAFDAGADGVAGLPGCGVLLGAVGLQRLVQRAGLEGELPAAAGGGGALI